MESVNQQFITSALIIGLGWILRRAVLGEEDVRSLVRLVFTVTLPALVVHSLGRAQLEPSLGLLPVIAVTYGVGMAALAVLVIFRGRDRKERGQAAMLVPGMNIGLFAYPFVEGVLGTGALKYLGMYDVGVAFIAFGVALGIASHFARPESPIDLRGIFRSLARSMPVVAYVVSLAIGMTGLHFPGPVLDVAAMLARANMPLALLILGMVLDFEPGAGRWGDIARVLGTRYGVGLAVGLALYAWLPFDATFRAVVLICMILPPPLIYISYAAQFGYNRSFVGLVLNLANVTSYFLMWGIFHLVPRVSGIP
jgi:malate permease and related proteins